MGRVLLSGVWALLLSTMLVFVVSGACPAAAEAASDERQSEQSQNQPEHETFIAQPAFRKSTLTGFTRARRSMTLVSEESGRVETVVADVGDTLGEEGVFARLDTTFIELELSGNRVDQERLKGDYEYYRKEMERYRKLVKTKNAAQSTLDANVRAHQAALQQLRAKQIEERVLVERIERYTLKGPPGWKVVTRYIEPGEWVLRGERVAELGQYDVLLVPYALTSSEYSFLRDSSGPLELRLTDLDTTVQASVAKVSPGFDQQTRKIPVDLEITEGSFQFRGGLRTELELELPDPNGAVLVPASALVKAYEEYFLIKPDGERVNVVYLGGTKDNMRRVRGENVEAGDRFRLHPVQ